VRKDLSIAIGVAARGLAYRVRRPNTDSEQSQDRRHDVKLEDDPQGLISETEF
jgi:hypothetical protein